MRWEETHEKDERPGNTLAPIIATARKIEKEKNLTKELTAAANVMSRHIFTCSFYNILNSDYLADGTWFERLLLLSPEIQTKKFHSFFRIKTHKPGEKGVKKKKELNRCGSLPARLVKTLPTGRFFHKNKKRHAGTGPVFRVGHEPTRVGWYTETDPKWITD